LYPATHPGFPLRLTGLGEGATDEICVLGEGDGTTDEICVLGEGEGATDEICVLGDNCCAIGLAHPVND